MDYRLTDKNGGYIEAAIVARADELTGARRRVEVYRDETVTISEESKITADEARTMALREAEAERDRRLADQWIVRELAAFEADCQALAANYRYDIASLQFERDRYFWGHSTSRSIQLPRYERALKIALERETARGKAA